MYNVLVFGKMSAADLTGFESFMVTSLLKSVTNYCRVGKARILPLTSCFADVAWFYASIPSSWDSIQKGSRLKEDPAYVIAHRTLTPAQPVKALDQALGALFVNFEVILLQNLVSLYRIISLILVYRTLTSV